MLFYGKRNVFKLWSLTLGRAKHQLRLQDAFLQLLFLVQSTTTNRPAAVSEGLLKGAIMSSFGTDQANREIWEADLGDSEALRLETRIRDTMLVIALDSLCLSEIVAGVEGSEKPEGSLLRSRDKIIAVHLFMLDQSDDLAQNDIDQENTEYPVWPMPIVCLAWSIVLWSLPPDMLPPSPGFDRPIYQEFASRALQISSGLFPWLAEVLQGPLFEAGRHAVSDDLLDEGATSRRVVMKGEPRELDVYGDTSSDLIMGLADMLQIDGINDRPGLIRTWELLFGVVGLVSCRMVIANATQRSPSTSNALCSDFWVTDSPVVARQAILEKSLYPDDPTTLPRILAALAGPNHDASVGAGPPALPAVQVYEYFSNLRSITFSVKSSCYRFIGKDAQARMSVEATRELILPGGQIIARGTRGVILSNEDSAANMVSWRAQISGWGLLVEITRVCAGAQSDDGSALPSPATADSSVLSVRDLGVKGDLVEILMAGMKLLRTVLNPSSGVAAEVLKSVRDVETVTSHDDTSELVLLKLVLFVLERPRQSEVTGVQSEMATLAIEILQALIPASSPHLCSALWSACPSFFGVRYPQRGIASAVIETDIGKGDFDVTLSLLRLIRSIVNAPNPHEGLVISALHLVFTDVWSHFLGWRYRNTTRKYELASLLVSIFRAALSHPLRADGLTPTEAAKYLIETFFRSASPLSYRPVIEIITQSGPLLRKLVATHRRHDARVVITSLESTIDFIATLLRIATFLGSPANALPKNILAAPVQMVDTLFDLAVAAWSQESSKVAIIQLLCTWLEAMSSDAQPLSLAGLLKDAERSCQSLARLAGTNDSSELQTSIWRLLGTIILTQPGCAAFCIGSIDAGSPGIRPLAIGQIISFDSTTTYAPEALAAVLGYVQSVLMSPRAGKAIQSLRENSDFWRAVFDIATFLVPAPPTFTLSMHSEDFAARIRHYAYGVQAKANATALLAIEVALISVTWQEGETNAQSLVLSLFRNASTLEEAAMGAVHNSCNRDLHETEANKLSAYGLSLPALKTVRLPNEREFGRTYLYGECPYRTPAWLMYGQTATQRSPLATSRKPP